MVEHRKHWAFCRGEILLKRVIPMRKKFTTDHSGEFARVLRGCRELWLGSLGDHLEGVLDYLEHPPLVIV